MSETPEVEKLPAEQPTEEVRRRYDELRAAWLLLDEELRRRSAAERQAGLKEFDFESSAERILESFGPEKAVASPYFVVVRYVEPKPARHAVVEALRQVAADKFPIRSVEAMASQVFGAFEFAESLSSPVVGSPIRRVRVVEADVDEPDMSTEVDLNTYENRTLKHALDSLSLSELASYEDGSRNKSKYHGLMRGLFPEQTAAIEAEFKAILKALKLVEPAE